MKFTRLLCSLYPIPKPHHPPPFSYLFSRWGHKCLQQLKSLHGRQLGRSQRGQNGGRIFAGCGNYRGPCYRRFLNGRHFVGRQGLVTITETFSATAAPAAARNTGACCRQGKRTGRGQRGRAGRRGWRRWRERIGRVVGTRDGGRHTRLGR
jgi:hypothetical protein